jgi:hypothetical protein
MRITSRNTLYLLLFTLALASCGSTGTYPRPTFDQTATAVTGPVLRWPGNGQAGQSGTTANATLICDNNGCWYEQIAEAYKTTGTPKPKSVSDLQRRADRQRRERYSPRYNPTHRRQATCYRNGRYVRC